MFTSAFHFVKRKISESAREELLKCGDKKWRESPRFFSFERNNSGCYRL